MVAAPGFASTTCAPDTGPHGSLMRVASPRAGKQIGPRNGSRNGSRNGDTHW